MNSSVTRSPLPFESEQSLLRPNKKTPSGLITKRPNHVETIHEVQSLLCYIFYHFSYLLDYVKTLYRESCWPAWCPQWDYQTERDYFRVLENGYEFNKTYISPTFMKFFLWNNIGCFYLNAMVQYCFHNGWCECIPPNCCCLSSDDITKTYFDRGVFDRQMCCFQDIGGMHVYTGPPTVYAGPCMASFHYIYHLLGL